MVQSHMWKSFVAATLNTEYPQILFDAEFQTEISYNSVYHLVRLI